MFRNFKKSPYFKISLMLLICGAILVAFSQWITNTHFSVGFETLNKTLAPIFVGVICTFLVCPIYNRCVKTAYGRFLGDDGAASKSAKERKRYLTIARVIATLICIIIVVGFIGALIYIIVPQIITSSINLVDTLPERLTSLSNWLNLHFPKFPQLAAGVDKLSTVGAKEIVEWIQHNILDAESSSFTAVVSNGVVTAVSSVVDIFVGILMMIYLLNYKETLFAMTRKFITATCSESKQQGLYEFADIFNETFINYIVGRIIDSAIIGVITYFVLLVFKIPFAPMVSVIVGVTNIIPFFGPFIGAIPSFMIIMLESPFAAFEFLVITLVLQQLDGNVLAPIIVGDAIGIGSFWVLIAVLIGGGLFGIGGMIFGVPVFAVIYRYVNKITTKSLNKKGANKKTTDYLSLEKFGIDVKTIFQEEEKEDK